MIMMCALFYIYPYISYNIRWTLMGNRWNLFEPPFKISFDIGISRPRDKSMDRKCRTGTQLLKRTCIYPAYICTVITGAFIRPPRIKDEGAAGRFWPDSSSRSRWEVECLWPDIKCLFKLTASPLLSCAMRGYISLIIVWLKSTTSTDFTILRLFSGES